jgi:hypothetical protein
MEMLRKEVLQSIALTTKAEKTAKGISKRKGKKVQRAISAKDVEWQGRFEELAEQVAKLSKAERLDGESIVEVKTRITSYPLTAFPVREKVAGATPLVPPLSPPTSGRRFVRDLSLSPPPENNQEEEGHSPPLRRRWHDAPAYSEDNRPDLDIRETRWHTCPSDS